VFAITLVRTTVQSSQVTGRILLNDETIGLIHEDVHCLMPTGCFSAHLFVETAAGPFLSADQTVTNSGEFLIEIVAPSQTNGLVRRGGEPGKFEGAVVLGSLDKDPLTGQRYLNTKPTVRILRRSFYEDGPVQTNIPNQLISVTISNSAGLRLSRPAPPQILRLAQ
jgi:hypothetical protein